MSNISKGGGGRNNGHSTNGSSAKRAGNTNTNNTAFHWRALASLDMYRKVPIDLLEGSYEGRIISWVTIIIIVMLFTMETISFQTTRLITNLALDNATDLVEVKFNITMMDLNCDYATIDIVSVLGKEQNVTKWINKWTVDADGVQGQYMKRNLQQHDIIDIELHDTTVTQTLEELHKDGEDAIPLEGKEKLELALQEYDFVFVDYYAMWCSHCRMLMPTWEKFAEVMYDAKRHDTNQIGKHLKQQDYTPEEYEQATHATNEYTQNSILIAKVDCVKYSLFCREQMITSYPTLRLFIDGKRYVGGDFRGHRTVFSFIQFVLLAEEQTRQKKLRDEFRIMREHAENAMNMISENMTSDEKLSLEQFEKQRHDERMLWNPDEHPGCRMAGRIILKKAPAHFYIQAQSKAHTLPPSMTNVSHEIHHFSVHGMNPQPPGAAETNTKVDDFVKNKKRNMIKPEHIVPQEILDKRVLQPMDGNVYVTHNYHEAYHHYIKLVSTNKIYYQMVQNSQLMKYPSDTYASKVPEAKFIIDLSPIAVSYKTGSTRTWYDYCTSLMAIIGGTFTVVGIIESFIRMIKQQRLRKLRKRQLKIQRQHQQQLEQDELVHRQQQQEQLKQLQQEKLFQNNNSNSNNDQQQPVQQEVHHRTTS